MSKFLFSIFGLFLVAGCSKDLPDSYTPTVLEWEVGANNFNVIQSFSTTTNGDISIEMSTNSYCPGSGIELILEVDGSVQLLDTVSIFPHTIQENLPAGANVNLETNVVEDMGNGNICVWLGLVDCVATY